MKDAVRNLKCFLNFPQQTTALNNILYFNQFINRLFHILISICFSKLRVLSDELNKQDTLIFTLYRFNIMNNSKLFIKQELLKI